MRRNPLIVGRSRWGVLALTLTLAATLFVVTSGAQAVVVNDQGVSAGVALVPGTALPSGVTASTATGACSDPWLAADFGGPTLPASGLCYRGGAVMHSNETFALTWDPLRRYWQTTRGYMEQFLGDVASGSGSLASPYADTAQYQDAGGRAQNSSRYGGGCVDLGSVGGFSCQLGSWNGSGTGTDYPSVNGCTPTGQSYPGMNNDHCLTDSQLQTDLSSVISQSGLIGRTQPGYTPLVVLMLPPGVETCLDSSGTLCSANSAASGLFCSYHSEVNVGGTNVAYVVQPWTPYTGCDEPKLPVLPPNPTPQQLATDAGSRMVNPLSQGQIAAITNPGLNSWVALSGGEVNDFVGCGLNGPDGDTVPVGGGSYVLRREGNNGGAISPDPNTYFGCVPNVILSPSFVVPSAVNAGDVVAFDGSASATTLLVPETGYTWDFGDGTGAVGPSVEHIFPKGGNYTVKLMVTDRGGFTQTLVQTVSVFGANGVPVPPANPPTSNPSNVGQGAAGLLVRMQLLPESLRGVLRSGMAVQLSANEPANGIAWVTVTRATAKRLHIHASGRNPVIARGTVSSVKDGTGTLHFKLSRAIVAKLKGLKHVTLTLHISLVGPAHDHLTIDAGGSY